MNMIRHNNKFIDHNTGVVIVNKNYGFFKSGHFFVLSGNLPKPPKNSQKGANGGGGKLPKYLTRAKAPYKGGFSLGSWEVLSP